LQRDATAVVAEDVVQVRCDKQWEGQHDRDLSLESFNSAR
jgi:hypothetical protein